MAFPSGGVGTGYGNTSRVTDVTRFIYQIVPEDKPFTLMIGEDQAKDVIHQFQKRTFSVRRHNAQAIGFTFDFPTQNRLPTRNTNICQLIGDMVRVSDTEKNSSHYAIDDLFSDQMKTALAVIGTDYEHALIRGSAASGDGTVAAGQMQGLLCAVMSGLSTYTNFGGTALSETLFNQTVQRLWEFGAEPRDAMVGGAMKRAISGYTGANTRFIPAEDGRLIRTISDYETDFWPVSIHLSRDVFTSSVAAPTSAVTTGSAQNGDSIVFFDISMLRKAWLQPVLAERVARTAHSTDGVITLQATLDFGHENGHAWIANASASN